MIKETFLIFFIVNFAYLDSNIPTGPAYGTYISQLVRMGRICGNFTSFANRNYKLTTRLIKQGFRYERLCVAFKKFSQKHQSIFSKCNATLKQHVFAGICLPVCGLSRLTKHVTQRNA